MLTNSQVNYSLNIGLHMLILFTFLTIFFFAYVSKLEKKAASDAMEQIIEEQTGNILAQFNKFDGKFTDKPIIKWSAVRKLAQDIVDKNQGEDKDIKENNEKLRVIGISMIVGLLILWIGSVLFFKFIQKRDINLGHIVVENLVIFAFIGVIEYGFFTKVASKYIPVTPDFVAIRLLERIKYRVSKNFGNS